MLGENTSITGTLGVTGNITGNSDLTIDGNTTLGNAAGDTLTINGTAVSIPNNLNIDGNTLFVDASGNRVGIGTTTPLEALDISGNATVSGNLTLGGGNRSIQTTGLSTLTLGGSTTGNIVIDSGSGNIQLSDFTTDQGLLYTDALGDLEQLAPGSNGQILTIAGGNLSWTTSGAINFWQRNSGGLAPDQITNDLLLGGISSISAKFAFLNNAGGTPVASIGGNLSLSGSGTLTTLNNQTLTLGGSGTGNIVIDSGSSNITLSDFTTDEGLLYTNAVGDLQQLAPGSDGQVLSITGGALSWITSGALNFWQRNNGALAPDQISNDLLVGGISTDTAKFAFVNSAGGTPTASISANSGNINTFLTGLGNLGTTNNQTLTLGGSTTGNIVIDSGSGNIVLSDNTSVTGNLDASGILSSGTSDAFIVDVNGNTLLKSQADLRLGDNDTNYTGFQAPSNLTSDVIYTLPTADGSLNYALTTNGTGTLSWNQVALGTNYWKEVSGSLLPINQTYDLIVGGTGTSTARFAVTNVAGGVTTATLSAGATGGTYLTADGVLQTTANQTLTLGGATTGNILLSETTDLATNVLLNIGNSGTDFSATGGLTLADDLVVNGGDITGGGNLTITPTTTLTLNSTGAVSYTHLTLPTTSRV